MDAFRVKIWHNWYAGEPVTVLIALRNVVVDKHELVSAFL